MHPRKVVERAAGASGAADALEGEGASLGDRLETSGLFVLLVHQLACSQPASPFRVLFIPRKIAFFLQPCKREFFLSSFSPILRCNGFGERVDKSFVDEARKFGK